MKISQLKVNQAITGCIRSLSLINPVNLVSFGGFGFGCVLAWTATALPSLEETGQVGYLSLAQKSWIGSLLAIGALVGCPIAGLLMNTIGRKKCLWCFSLIGLAGWISLAFAKTPIYLYLGRILTGASTGGYTIVVPVYVSEIASKENRGLIGSLFLVMLCLGKLFSNVVGCFMEASFASTLCAIHPLLYSLFLFFIPEAPNVLLKQNQKKDAYKVLRWLNAVGITSPIFSYEVNETGCQDNYSKLECMKLESSITSTNQTPKASWKDLSSPEVLKPVTIVVIQMIFSQFCGINVSTFYTVEIFQLSGDTMINPKMATIVLAVIQTIGCLPCSIFVDKYGRRLLLMSSFFAMSLAMGGFAAYFYVQVAYPQILIDYEYLSLVPLIALVVYNLAYSWGVGSIVWIVMSEILPPKIIGPASSLANAIFWGAAFIVTQAFQMFKTDIPLYFWFLFFTVTCIIGCLFNKIALPETKGMSLEEIQSFFLKRPKTLSSVVQSSYQVDAVLTIPTVPEKPI